MIHIGKLPAKYAEASALGVGVGALAAIFSSKVLCQLPLPFTIEYWDQHLTGWIALRLHELNPALFADIATRYQYVLDSSGFPIWQVTGRFDLAALIGVGVGAAVTWLIGKPLPDTKISTDRHLYDGKEALKRLRKQAKEEIKISGTGVRLHPAFEISRARATRGIFIWGSIGSGKTQVITPMILDAIHGGHKTLIHDIKGDYTSSLNGPFALLAPWDARTMAWDLSKDVLNSQAAYEFAAQIIQATDDPIWSDGARQILCAVIMQLQKEKPQQWTWRDLYLRSISSQDKLLEIVRRQKPEIEIVLQSESKTTDGILMNYVIALRVIGDLATAWGDVPPEKRVSITEWLHSDNPKFKTVIMQNNSEYECMAQGYIKAFMSMLSGRINTPAFGDSATRKVFLFLDELPQMGKVALNPILSCARSKGVVTVVTAQDKSQLEYIYNEYIAKTWSSMVGTHITLKTNSSDTAQYIANTLFGFARVEHYFMVDGVLQPPTSENRLLMEPTDVSDYFGVYKDGVRGGLIGFGHAYVVKWPFTKIETQRASSILGDWMDSLPSKEIDAYLELKKQQAASAPPPAQLPAEPQLKLNPRKPKVDPKTLKRSEILAMAESGTDMRDAAELMDEMTPDTPPAPQAGVDHE